MSTPTLLKDLLDFADACESGDWGDLDDEAKRLRAHASRLARYLRMAVAPGANETAVKAILDINGGGGPLAAAPQVIGKCETCGHSYFAHVNFGKLGECYARPGPSDASCKCEAYSGRTPGDGK